MLTLHARLLHRFVRVTCDLRRLDAAARSPIFSHTSGARAGVSTVRARQLTEAYYLSNTASRWLSFRLQFNGTALVGAISILAIALTSNGFLSVDMADLAITYALTLADTLNQVNRETADCGTQMVSVERVHAHSPDIPLEAERRRPSTTAATRPRCTCRRPSGSWMWRCTRA